MTPGEAVYNKWREPGKAQLTRPWNLLEPQAQRRWENIATAGIQSWRELYGDRRSS